MSVAEEKFWERTVKADGCWQWTGGTCGRNEHIYGQFHAGGKKVLAHRWAYEHFRGPIGEGLVIDHLCRNTRCVNPEHMEPVTDRENRARGLRGPLTTHCPAGHPYSEENTRIGHGGKRQCRSCDRARWHRRKHRDLARSQEESEDA